jgi:hypothetical protein
MNHTIGFGSYTDIAYGQVWIDGVTSQPGPTPGLWAQLGFGPAGSIPGFDPGWIWTDAEFNVDSGNNDEFMAQMLPQEVGVFHYVYRYSTSNGAYWTYADLNGPFPAGNLPPNPGVLTVSGTGDLIPPAAPTGLTVLSAAPNAIELGWDLHPNGDGDLAGFEIYRDGMLHATLTGALVTDYTDLTVAQGNTYEYFVLAVDSSYNRSGPSNTVTATAEPRTVAVTFHVTVPAQTPGGSTVYIAGSLHLLDGDLPEWDPAGVALTPLGANEWEITLTGKEGTNIEYKYTLGSWDFVEKGAACEELGNRTLTLDYGTDGNMLVSDTVLNWRNVLPCGS